MLYAPDLHERLTERAWNEGWIRDAIARLVADAGRRYDDESLWPAHEWDAYTAPLPLTDLYAGAAGVAWALHVLRPLSDSRLDPDRVVRRTLAHFRSDPEFLERSGFPEQRRSSLLCGESGILLVAYLVRPTRDLADDLFALVSANLDNPANELMWGVPGTLLVARTLAAATGEERWSAVVRESEDALRAQRADDGFWQQTLEGRTTRYLGPVHGLVGNVLALGEPGKAAAILRDCAVAEDGLANWPPAQGGEPNRLQWCHGAPGILLHAHTYLDDDLLLGGAELVWRAGPFGDEKGAGICHGTAGNGYALLRAFEHTGDERWLDRARRFAVHALEQAERLPGRYALFTGGVGAAHFAADCLEGRARFPVLEDLPAAGRGTSGARAL